MNSEEWLVRIALGMVLGLLGQGVRIVAGLKKLNDEAAKQTTTLGALFETRTLVLSLLIGLIAGGLAALQVLGGEPTRITNETLLALAGAGYSGADFIESVFVKKG
jgi:hypothetical protein